MAEIFKVCDETKIEAKPGAAIIALAQMRSKIPSIAAIPRLEIPPPKLAPNFESVPECAAHIIELYTAAFRYVMYTKCTAASRRAHVAQAKAYLIARDLAYARELYCALRNLRDGGSQLPLSIYAYWMFSWWYTKSPTPPEVWRVFSPKRLLDASHRRMFWEQLGDQVCRSRVFWPKSAKAMLSIMEEFKQMAADLTSEDDVIDLWRVGFGPSFDVAQVAAEAEIAEGRRVMNIHRDRYDLRLYIDDCPLKAMQAEDILTRSLGAA